MDRRKIVLLVGVLIFVGATISACAGLFGTGDPEVDGFIAQRTVEAAQKALRETERAAIQATGAADLRAAEERQAYIEELAVIEARIAEQQLLFDQETARLNAERANQFATESAYATATAIFPTEQAVIMQMDKERRDAEFRAFIDPIKRALWIAIPLAIVILLIIGSVKVYNRIMPIFVQRSRVTQTPTGAQYITEQGHVVYTHSNLAVTPSVRVDADGTVESVGIPPEMDLPTYLQAYKYAQQVRATAALPRVYTNLPSFDAPPPAPALPERVPIHITRPGEEPVVDGYFREVQNKLLSSGEEGSEP